MNLSEARSKVFQALFSCPVCGAGPLSAEKSDHLETVEFVCGAAFFLQAGSVAGVAQICPAPSHVAINHLERQAEAMLTGKVVAK